MKNRRSVVFCRLLVVVENVDFHFEVFSPIDSSIEWNMRDKEHDIYVDILELS